MATDSNPTRPSKPGKPGLSLHQPSDEAKAEELNRTLPHAQIGRAHV